MPHYKPNNSHFEKLFDLAVIAVTLTMGFLWTIASIFIAAFQTKFPAFSGSLLRENHSLILQIILSFLHIHVTSIMLLCTYTALWGALLHAGHVVPFFCKNFRLGRKSYETLTLFRSQNVLCTEYRAAQVLQKVYNDLVGRFLIPFQCMATLMFIFAGVGLLKLRQEMESVSIWLLGILLVITPGIWLVILIVGAYLHLNGMKILRSWKYGVAKTLENNSTLEKKIMSKFRLSCSPLSITFKKAYTIRPGSVLVFVRGLIKGLMRTLLAT